MGEEDLLANFAVFSVELAVAHHYTSIYLILKEYKAGRTNKEDGVMVCGWATSFKLEMKCPVLSYCVQPPFVQFEKWGHFSRLSERLQFIAVSDVAPGAPVGLRAPHS